MQRCNRRSRKDFLRLFVAQRKTLQSTYSSISQRKVHMLPQNPLFFQIIPTTKQTNPPQKNLILSPRKSWIPRLTPFSRSEFLFSPTESILLTSGWRKINDVCECKSASWATEVKTRWMADENGKDGTPKARLFLPRSLMQVIEPLEANKLQI